MTPSWLAILNRVAGPHHSERWWQELTARIQRELNAQVSFTQGPGHARELASGSKSFDGLAVYGGDGTVSEVVNGMSLESQHLLLLAGGTGNGLARDLRLVSLEQAFTAARGGRLTNLDLIRADFRSGTRNYSRLIISTASVGYAAEVVVLANRYFKRLGAFCYPISATLQAARQHSLAVELDMDGKPREKRNLTNLMINNTRHAGNFSAFRGSELDDGRMEVLMARAGFWSQFLHNLAVLSKTYFYRSAAEITLHRLFLALPTSQKLMLDGEIWEDVHEVRFEVLPKQLKCLI